MTWFKANRTLPKRQVRVLFYPGKYGQVTLGHCDDSAGGPYWTDETESIGDEGAHTVLQATHWMHLPEKP